MTGTVLALALGVVSVLRWIASYFSDASTLRRFQLSLAERRAKEQVEAERLKATYERIDREPAKEGQALVDSLNTKTRPKP